MTRTLNGRETNTILHALRSMAANARDDVRDACHDACDHFIDAPALTSVEIDALCESDSTLWLSARTSRRIDPPTPPFTKPVTGCLPTTTTTRLLWPSSSVFVVTPKENANYGRFCLHA